MMHSRLPLAFSLVLTALGLRADTVSLQSVADAVLMEIAPSNSLGGALFFNAGTAGNGNRNRALLLFDLASVLPAEAIITDATLTLDIVRQPTEGAIHSFFDLRRVLQPWGEGVQVPADPNSPGLGGLASAGEATWNFRFAHDTPWSVPGGLAGVDFSTDLSGKALVQSLGEQVVFESNPTLLGDLQSWLNQPGANFGWMLMTEDESIGKTARGFASRESGFGPTLTITFTVVPEPSSLALVGFSLLFFTAIWRRR